jgi:hypothetical protein
MSVYKERGRWRWSFTYNGKRYSGTAPLASNLAKTAEALERAEMDRLITRKFTGAMPTWTEFAPRFVAYQKEHTKPLTHLNHEHVVRLHLTPILAKLKLDAIGTGDIDALKASWTCEPSSKNMRLRVLRRALSIAIDWEILHALPKFKFVPERRSTRAS